MSKKIEIVTTSSGALVYTVEKETKENIFIEERSVSEKKMRYSKKEGRLEQMSNGKWSVYVSDEEVLSVNIYEEQESANVAPTQGAEPSECEPDIQDTDEEVELTGEQIICIFSENTGVPISKTKKGEYWIRLTKDDSYVTVLESLLHEHRFSKLRWETKKGSSKTKIWNEETGMTLILKNGPSAYIWCIENGK